MNYFYVEPEVAGGLGANTVMDSSVHPPIVRKLHYHLEGWLGDVLLESFPSFVVTENAMQHLQAIHATGVRFDDVEVTMSDQFEPLDSNRRVPRFVWLRVEGKAGVDDFGAAADGRLVVSDRVLEVLKKLGINNALVTSAEP